MIVLIRSNSITSDPRVDKYIQYLKSNKNNFTIIGWDRSQEKIKSIKSSIIDVDLDTI